MKLHWHPFSIMPWRVRIALSVAESRRKLVAHLDLLEPYLARQDWLVGSYSLADICYAPLVLVLDRVGLSDEIAKRSGVARWVVRLRARPAVAESMMPPSPGQREPN